MPHHPRETPAAAEAFPVDDTLATAGEALANLPPPPEPQAPEEEGQDPRKLPPLDFAVDDLRLGALALGKATPLGARAAHALPVASLKRVFALVLYALAGYMVWRALSA